MKIMQINAIYGNKSTGIIMADIGAEIEKSGNQAFFAYQKTSCNVTNGYQIGNPLDWKIHALLARILGQQGFYSSSATKKLIQYIDKNNFDVIHLHNLHSNYINIDILLRYIAEKNIPTIITMHDCWWFTGKCFHYIDCECNKFIDGCDHCPKRNAPPRSVLFDRAAKCWRIKRERLLAIPRLKIVGCSKWVSDEAKKGFLKQCDVTQIFNGIDTSVFKPYDVTDLREKLFKKNSFVIIGMANKWLDARNSGSMDRIYCIPNTQILLVGCTEIQITKLEHDYPHIICMGYVSSRKELAKLYSVADVFVNLTHADTLPTVNIESICCGTPVITYDCCGGPELIDEETGIIVPEDDVNGLVLAIEKVRNKKYVDCASVGNKRFNKEATYHRYIEVYNDVVQSGERK